MRRPAPSAARSIEGLDDEPVVRQRQRRVQQCRTVGDGDQPGTTAASVSSITATTGFSPTNNCGGSIAAGGSCTINVTFTPTTGGNTTSTPTLNSNAPGSPLTVSLSGRGVTPTTNLAQGQPVTASGSQSGFPPTNAVDAKLTFTANTGWPAGQLSELQICSGGGTNGSALTALPSSLSFGNVTVGSTSSTQTVTVSNPGSTAASISSVSVSGPFAQTLWLAASTKCGRCQPAVVRSPGKVRAEFYRMAAISACLGAAEIPSGGSWFDCSARLNKPKIL